MSLAYGQQQQAPQAQQPPIAAPNQQQHRPMPPNRGPQTGPPPPSPAQIQKILDENCSLIQTIQEYQTAGKGHECMNYHQSLHRNLVYLAQLAGISTHFQLISIFLRKFDLFKPNDCFAAIFRFHAEYLANLAATACIAIVDRATIAANWTSCAAK